FPPDNSQAMKNGCKRRESTEQACLRGAPASRYEIACPFCTARNFPADILRAVVNWGRNRENAQEEFPDPVPATIAQSIIAIIIQQLCLRLLKLFASLCAIPCGSCAPQFFLPGNFQAMIKWNHRRERVRLRNKISYLLRICYGSCPPILN